MIDIATMIEPIAGLVFVGMMGFFLYNILKSKAIFMNQDGTYKEVRIKSGQTKIDLGKDGGVYNLRPNAFVKRLILGILPMTRIFFMIGSPEPISFHEGIAVHNPEDLKLPVYGVYECPKCKGMAMKIINRVGSRLLRSLLYETRTEHLGRPESPKFKMKYLVWLAAAAGVVVLVLVATSGAVTVPTGP